MLKLRVIPCLDVKDGRVVKGVNFVELRDAGDPVEQAAPMIAAGADELTFLDITASHENRDTILDVVARTAARVFHAADGRRWRALGRGHARLLLAGADKVSHQLRRGGAARARADAATKLRQPVRRRRGRCRKRAAGQTGRCSPMAGAAAPAIDAVEWARQVVALGAGEILLTSMDRDGTGRASTSSCCMRRAQRVRVPVVASGGVGTLEHFVDGAQAGATGLLAASVFHFGTFTIGRRQGGALAAPVCRSG